MKTIKVSPITKKIVVRFSNQDVKLPEAIQVKIDSYWNSLIASGKTYKRGEVFTVTNKKESEDLVDILVEKTDYAHYLYCQNVEPLEKNGVRIIHTAVLVETSDDYIVFGEMGHQTSRAGIHQLCGGGIDNGDLKGKYFDFKHNISKELKEELDIGISDNIRIAYFDEAYIKEGGPTDKITVVYKIVLNETKDEFLERYNGFAKKLQDNDESPEFEKIITLKKEKDEINKFFSQKDIKADEYMKPLFDQLLNELEA